MSGSLSGLSRPTLSVVQPLNINNSQQISTQQGAWQTLPSFGQQTIQTSTPKAFNTPITMGDVSQSFMSTYLSLTMILSQAINAAMSAIQSIMAQRAQATQSNVSTVSSSEGGTNDDSSDAETVEPEENESAEDNGSSAPDSTTEPAETSSPAEESGPASGPPVDGDFLKPVDTSQRSSSFGMRRHPITGENKMHNGADYALPAGTPVRATADGVVSMTPEAQSGGYGNLIKIDHGGGTESKYAHLQGFRPDLKPGQRVRKGDIIGYVGSTGQSTGNHLHFEILKNGKAVDPEIELRA